MENSLQTYQPQPVVVQHQSVFFNIKAFEEGQRMATLLAKSKLIPQNFQENLPDCLIALELAMRIGASPMAVMQNTYIVHGRPGYSAQFVIAMINSCGRYSPLRFELSGEGDSRECYAWAYELATGDKLLGTPVSVAMAKSEGWWSKKDKNGRETSKWQSMPELMLRYRAAAFFGRMYAPELLMGIKTTEEIVDTAEPATSSSSPNRSASANDLNARFSSPPAGPIIDAEVVTPTGFGTPPANPAKPAETRQDATANQPAAEPPPPTKEKAKPEVTVSGLKSEIIAVEKWTDLFNWPDKNKRRLKSLGDDEQRSEVISYCNALMHMRQIDEKVSVEGVNQFIAMKMVGLKKQFEDKHPGTAEALFDMVDNHAKAKISELSGGNTAKEAQQPAQDEPPIEEEPPIQDQAGDKGKPKSLYLKFQEQLYSKESSTQLDQWAMATHDTREKQLSENEHAALLGEISERRAELKAIEGEQAG